MKTRFFITGLIGMFICNMSMAQWNWPEDRATAEEKNALYTDNFKQGNYRKAADYLSWLLVNAPNLNKSIYINGVRIYDGLASEEADQAKKLVYQDSTLLLYDLRIKYFGEEANVLDRKAFNAYKYYNNDPKRYKDLFTLFKSAFELNGKEIMDNNLLPYMDVVRRYKLSGNAISDDEVLAIYDEIINIATYKIDVVKKNVENLKVVVDQVNTMLPTIIDVDCNFIENTLGPKLKAEPDNLKLATNIMRLAFAGKCTDGAAFLEAAIVVQKLQPEYGLAKLIGQSYAGKKNYELAMTYLTQSVELTDDNTKKADSYYSMAVIQANLDRKVSARDFARKSVAADPTQKDAYKIIGNLYYNSFDDCKKGENPVNDKAVFIAAYEMFRLAGDAEGMKRAQAQFPTMEEIFTWNLQVGQQYRIECWINETVAIQKR
ncbi:MAG: hypothetical protein U5K79_18635 [Cyclobacteriaceae bacterium]|nr:hypothetical protein [Cyclobacteriaceae bacterium]